MLNLIGNKKTDCHVKTSCSVLEYSFKWTLEEFSNFMNLREIVSPNFYPEFNIPWWISLIRKDVLLSDVFHKPGKFWELTIHRGDGYEKVQADCHIFITIGNTTFFQEIFVSMNCTDSNVTNREIKVPIIKNETNNFVEFALKIKRYKTSSVQLDTKEKYSDLSEDVFKQDIQKSLIHDLGKLYDNHLNTDIQLSIDGEILEVHQSILMARSPVFAKMLQQNMMEHTNNVIVIEDINIAAMKEVVAFMYGQAKRNYDSDMAMQVYYAADKYGLKSLQEMCAHILVSKLDIENSYLTLQLADRHCDKWLKKEVIRFMISCGVLGESIAKILLNPAIEKQKK